MNHLKDLLKDNSSSEPPQVSALKKHISDNYGFKPKIFISPRSYTVSVPNAALAYKIRVNSVDISTVCKLDKRLSIRINS